ncbi:MAG: AarF/UbiB family protein, partial [Kofleriaceae bacterium]
MWYALLTAVAVLFLVSVTLPVPRRVWAFAIYSLRYLMLWLCDAVGLRKLAMVVTGRRAEYQRLTRPILLRMWCEDMGPTFIKFGQIIASSGGMFPDPYVKEFQKVLDRVKPFPFAEVQRTLEQELGPERAGELAEIDRKPLASASIAQVHSARLRDGTPVVVKVQRPGIITRCMADMTLMRTLAKV